MVRGASRMRARLALSQGRNACSARRHGLRSTGSRPDTNVKFGSSIARLREQAWQRLFGRPRAETYPSCPRTCWATAQIKDPPMVQMSETSTFAMDEGEWKVLGSTTHNWDRETLQQTKPKA
eukprot:357886-Chlamydomonas_euryale.AAC.16